MIKEQVYSIIELIHYFLSKLGKLDRLQIIKLVYLADKYHLLKYGRTITNDRYYAMEYGPVASTVKDILDFDKLSMYDDEYKFAAKRIAKSGNNDFKPSDPEKSSGFEYLSESDIEAADFVVEAFGDMSKRNLINYTHKFPEWKKHEDRLKKHETRRENIPVTELFSTVDDRFKISKEHIQTAKDILLKCA